MSKFRALPLGRKVTIAAFALIMAQLIFRGWIVSGSWFLVDDFIFLSDVASGQDDLSWYFRIHQGHFMPASFVLVKLVASMGAFNWIAAAAEIIALQLLASLTCVWMLRTLFGNRPAILLPLAFYLFSALTMPSVLWWAVSINQLPHQIACFGAVAAHVMFLRSRRWAHAALATAFLILGFSTYTKTLFVPPILVLIALMYFASGPLGNRIWHTFISFWKAWVAYAFVTTTFVVSYLAIAPKTVGTRSSSLLELSGATVLETFGTSLIGGPWKWTPFGDGPISYVDPPRVGVVVAWVCIVAFIFYLWATRTRSLRALVLVAFYLTTSILTVFLGRAYVLDFLGGASVGRHLQYIADSAPILVLAMGLMGIPLLGAIESSTRRTSPFYVRRPSKIVIASLGLALTAGSIYSTLGIAKPWRENYMEKNFTQTATAEIRAKGALVADTKVPERVLSSLFSPHNEIRNYFAPLRSSIRITGAGNDLVMFNERGAIVPAILDGPVRTDADEGKKCPIRVKDKPKTIPMAPVLNYPFWMAIDYSANISGHIPLDYGIYRKNVPIEAGRHTLFIHTTGGYDSITLRPLVGQRICVRTVKVGGLSPGPVS